MVIWGGNTTHFILIGVEGNTIHAFLVRKVRDQAAVLPVPDAASLGAVLGSRTKVVVTEVKAVCSILHFLHKECAFGFHSTGGVNAWSIMISGILLRKTENWDNSQAFEPCNFFWADFCSLGCPEELGLSTLSVMRQHLLNCWEHLFIYTLGQEGSIQPDNTWWMVRYKARQ